VGVGIVDSHVLRDLEDRPLQLFAAGVDLYEIAIPLQMPDIAVRIQTEHGAPRRPAYEPACLRIVFDGAVIHADDDIAMLIELQLVRAATGSASARVALTSHVACFASRSFRQREGYFRCFAGLDVDAPEHV